LDNNKVSSWVKGELKIHSCPNYLCQHIEWALSEQFKSKVSLCWNQQKIIPSTMCTQFKWDGPIGLSSRIVSALSKWPKIRLEAFQERYEDLPAERYALSPNLGIYRAEINSIGETIVTESKLKAALERSRIENEPFEVELAFLLGTPWDEDLEPFRQSYVNQNIKWISRTG